MSELYPYQIAGRDFLAANDRAILGDAMGVGKTVQAIVAADKVGARRILVVCPAIARVNWAREFEEWQVIDRKVGVAVSSKDYHKVAAKNDVVVVSYSLPALSGSAKLAMSQEPWDVIVCDEAHMLRNRGTQRTKAVYGNKLDGVKGAIHNAKRVWLLSGTFMVNNAGDLYPHLRALFPEELGEIRNYTQFTNEFCVLKNNGFTDVIVGNRNVDRLAAMLRPHFLRRRSEDVLKDLPPLRWAHTRVAPDKLPPRPEMTPEETAVVDQARAKIAKGEDPADLAMHLSTLRRWTGLAKAPAVVELLNDMPPDEKVVVFFQHTAVAEAIVEGLGTPAGVIDGKTTPRRRQELIDAFQGEGGPRALLCQLQAASTALTLTAAAHVVFAENSWTAADMEQAAKRCHRIGQPRSVLVRVVSLAGSIDEDVNAALVKKTQQVKKLDALLVA